MCCGGRGCRAAALCAPSARRSACRTWARWPNNFAPARWWESLKVALKNIDARVGVSGGVVQKSAGGAARHADREFRRVDAASNATCPGLPSPARLRRSSAYLEPCGALLTHSTGLGTAGAATLRAVAPGISEALITTAAGLAAAIPAVIAYNLIGGSIREFASRGDDFALGDAECGRAPATCQLPTGPLKLRRCRGNGLYGFERTNSNLPLRYQHHATGGRCPGAADHLHGHGAGAAIRH